MTTTDLDLDRLARLLDRVEALERRVADGPNVTPTIAQDAYGNPGTVVPGELIESAWGNAVQAHVLHQFPNEAALNASTLAENAMAQCTDTRWLYMKRNGVWTLFPGQLLGSAFVACTDIQAGAPATYDMTAVQNIPGWPVVNHPVVADASLDCSFGFQTVQAQAMVQITWSNGSFAQSQPSLSTANIWEPASCSGIVVVAPGANNGVKGIVHYQSGSGVFHTAGQLCVRWFAQ